MQRNGHFDRYKEFSEKWVVPLTESKEIVEITDSDEEESTKYIDFAE